MTTSKRSAFFCVLLFCISLVFIQLAGCTESDEQRFGPAYNAERAGRGIPILGTTWTRSGGGGSVYGWKDTTSPTKGRIIKTVIVDARGKIEKESDIYLSGRAFPATTTAPSGRDVLSIEYDYTKEKTNPWHWHIPGGPMKGEGDTLAEAERILSEWGVTRLSP